MENNILNSENSENLNQGNSSFFDEKVSSSNSNEEQPKLRFSGYKDCWKASKLKQLAKGFDYGMNSAAVEYDGKNKYIRTFFF